MEIIGYIIIGLSIVFTLAWCINIRHKAKYNQVREKAMELQGLLMTSSIILVLVTKLSPFHLLWLIPASFILGFLSSITPLRILWVFSSIYFRFWYIGISNAGRKFYVQGEYEKAVVAFKEQIIKKPGFAEAYFNLALAYGKLQQYDNEIAAYKEAIAIMPNNSKTHFNLGNAYNEKGDKENAIEALKQAIKLSPDYLKAHYTICKTYAEVGDKENAFKEYEIIQKIDKRSADELKRMINTI